MSEFVSHAHRVFFYLVKALHYIITGFVLLAWLCPNQLVLITHVALVPLLLIHWKSYNNRCFLSDIEAKLSGVDIAEQEDSPFIRGLLRLFIKQEISSKAVVRVTYLIMFVVFSASAFRLLLQCGPTCSLVG